jgi:hypothetical protein
MLGVKKFFYYLFGIVMVVFGGGAIYLLQFVKEAPEPAIVTGVVCLIALVIMLIIKSTTKCPKCKKVWVGKKIGDEDLGVCSNTFTRKSGDSYHTYEKHRHVLSYRCISCGHEWQKTVERDKQLD